jgi:uncharacterized protein (TIGR03437 family)
MKRWILAVAICFTTGAFSQDRIVAPPRPSLRIAQSLTINNYLQPDGLPARDSLTALSGVTFADSSAFEIFQAPTTLNGVTVWVDDIPQPIRSVTPAQVVFVLTRLGVQSTIRVRTQFGTEFSAPLRGTGIWPGLLINGEPDSPTAQNFIPLAIYALGETVAPVTNDPVPVSQQTPTMVMLHGSGWRNAAPGQIRVRLNGIECRVAGTSPHPLWIGVDVVTFEIPAYLAGNGAMDVTVYFGNRESNFARIYLGDAIQ